MPIFSFGKVSPFSTLVLVKFLIFSKYRSLLLFNPWKKCSDFKLFGRAVFEVIEVGFEVDPNLRVFIIHHSCSYLGTVLVQLLLYLHSFCCISIASAIVEQFLSILSYVALTKLKPLILLFRFWGWGGEDDDLFTRVKTEKLTIFRENQELGRFKVLISI